MKTDNSRFDDHRGGESYRPGSSRGFGRRSRSPPRIRSPPTRLVADTWAPSSNRKYSRHRSPSAPSRRRSRSPQSFTRTPGIGSYPRAYPPRRFSPRRDLRHRSPPPVPRRPRSSFRGDRAREIGWGPSSTSRHSREPSADREYGYYQRGRRQPSDGRHTRSRSSSRHKTPFDDGRRVMAATRARSPLFGGRRGRDVPPSRHAGQKSWSRSPSSKRHSASAPMFNSKRSTPLDDRTEPLSRGNQSRSPQTRDISGRRALKDGVVVSDQIDNSSSIFQIPETRTQSPTADKGPERSSSIQIDVESSRHFHAPDPSGQNQTSYPSNAPSQPKAFSTIGNHKSSPPGLPHPPKPLPSHARASSISLLSAPTKPRGNYNFKESNWGSTSMRRGLLPLASHGLSVAPRSSQSSATGVDSQRPIFSRSGSVHGTSSAGTTKYSRYLAGLQTVLPGGRLTPFDFDTITERRLSQLESDRDRLLDQIAERQSSKRAGLRDWDRLDRESSVCALKSELAESHLQCITDAENHVGRVLF